MRASCGLFARRLLPGRDGVALQLGSAQVQWPQQIEQRCQAALAQGADHEGTVWAQFDVPKAEHTLRRFDGWIPPVDPEGAVGRVLDTIEALIRIQIGTHLTARLGGQQREGGRLRRDAAVALHGRIGAERMPIRQRLTALCEPLATAAGAVLLSSGWQVTEHGEFLTRPQTAT